MRLIDQELTTRYGIDLPIMMENAGKSLALLVKRMLRNSLEGRRIACLIGKGNNGGGGVVAARHLYNWGAGVNCILAVPAEKMKKAAARQLTILRNIGVKAQLWKSTVDLESYDLLVDALIGYNLRGNPEPPFSQIISASEGSGTPILALDLPSGLDATTGKAYTPCVIATSTLTLMLPKKGLMARSARRFVGQLYLADISAPLALYRSFGVEGPLFTGNSIIRLY